MRRERAAGGAGAHRKKAIKRELEAGSSGGRDPLLLTCRASSPSKLARAPRSQFVPSARAGRGRRRRRAQMAMSAGPLLAALLLPALLLSAASAADSTNNPADQLVSLVNSNRTASKASSLSDNQGLGCIALQYIKAYQGQCSDVRDKKPPESSFAEKFAPDCGVQVATLSKITGRLVACQSKYPSPPEALDILVNDAKDLQVLHSKNHTEIGVAVSGTDGGGPYFWCVLFSGGKPATSFKVDGEVPKTAMHPGCFSGNNDDCAGPSPTNGAVPTIAGASRLVAALLFVMACALAL